MKPQRRLADLAEHHGLAESALPAFAELLTALIDPQAPTSVHRATQVVDVHVADSLAALEVEELRAAERICDLGSGAGLPGLALAAALPSAEIALVEANARKCAFIRETAEAMGLSNATVVQARAEEWAEGRARQDVVCARAVAALPVLLEYAAPLLRLDGVLIAWKGEVGEEESADGAAAARALGFEPVRILAVDPFAGSERRTLHCFRKTGETPPRYPRRAGMAVKRPLSAPRPPGGRTARV